MPRLRLRTLAGSGLLTVVLLLGVVSSALADRAFAPRFSTNANGDIAIVGNTLETCQSSAADCAGARAGDGSALNNNGFTMERVDVDHTMLDSSSARLSLPVGARVLFAGLYYGARTSAGTRGKAAPNASPAGLRRVDLKIPGGSGFEQLSSEVDESSEVSGAYAAFADVTGQVRRSGSGVYTVANVQSATGEDRYAGWALAVAYEAAGDPPRNLTVFDGLQSVTQSKPALEIPVSGFQTPLSGPVRTKLGFVAYEGDRGLAGDKATLDGKLLSDKVNPENNFFNSTISGDGRNLTDKTPDYVNQLGFDAKQIAINGFLANGATKANIALRTSSDQYLPHVITFATDLYAPIIHASKTVANLTHPDGPTRAGDTLRYTVRYANEGLEAARNLIARDQLPADTTYLSGSLRIAGAPASVANPSDLPGDDLGEYESAQHTVRFFLGDGAAADHGGELAAAGAPGDRAEISFEVRVDENITTEREIRNEAVATFIAPTLGKELTALSSEANVRATPGPMGSEPADLAVSQSETVAPGGPGDEVVDDHTTIENHGPGDATDVVLQETTPPGATIESATVDQGSCSIGATEVTCTVPRLESGGSVEVNIVILEPASDAASGSVGEATVTASQFDPKPANDSDEVTAPMPPAIPAPPSGGSSVPITDLAVQDRVSAAEVELGDAVTETITIVNHGPAAATGVDLTGALSAGADVTDVKPGAAHCTSRAPLHCTFASLAAGARQTITLTVRPLLPGRLIDAAGVSGGALESNYANNMAKVAANVRRRATTASVRIVPVRPVASAGQVVGFVVTVAATERTPGAMPKVCVTLPKGLRLAAAPGAIANGSRVCWELTDLIRGRPRSFHLSARVGSVPRSGAVFGVSARLTGANFAARRAATAVRVPLHPVACPSSVGAAPPARIAC